MSNSTNNYYKIRSGFYNGQERVEDLNATSIQTETHDCNSKYYNVTVADVTNLTPSLSLEYTGNEYLYNTSYGGINISDGFNCLFKVDTAFIGSNGFSGCLGFAWTNTSLGENAIPTNSEDFPDGALTGVKGVTLTLYPCESDDYTSNVGSCILSYKASIEGNITQSNTISIENGGIDLYNYNLLSVKHESGQYNFYLNDKSLVKISDDNIDVDNWEETEGYFTATLISTPAVEANIEVLYVSDNNIHLTQEEKLNLNNLGTSVLNYKGNETDDTGMFQRALADTNVRRVYVPGGTYVISGELIIRENCELELSQDAVLTFTDPTINCISMKRSASLVGNHATIIVPNAFMANVINIDTDNDWIGLEPDENGIKWAETEDVPPFKKWDPQWKLTRYITDINITKPDQEGFHYSNTTTCEGTAVYIRTASNNDYEGVPDYLWGMNASGIRIAGGFEYGIFAKNEGEGWNHDMRIEAITQACKVGAYLENCNNVHLALCVQPVAAYDTSGTSAVYNGAYATNGIYLKNSKNVDLSGSRVWDWSDSDNNDNNNNSLWTISNENQHIRLDGDCYGLILDDFLYYEMDDYDIRDLIYTQTPSNYENMTILQEPVSKFISFDTDKTKASLFVDRIIDTSEGNKGEIIANFGTTVSGMINCKDASNIIINGVMPNNDQNIIVAYYDENYKYKRHYSVAHNTADSWEKSFTNSDDASYFRFCYATSCLADNLEVTIDGAITKFRRNYLKDGIYVKKEYIEG